MTWLLATVGVVLLALSFMRSMADDRAGADRWWLYPVELGAAAETAPRTGSRPTAQTGAAVLALALALDVTGSAAPAAESQAFAHAYDAQAPIAWTTHSLAGDGWIL